MNLYLLSYGELALKGKNRVLFLRKLAENIKNAFKPFGESKVLTTFGRLFVETDLSPEIVEQVLVKRFGLAGFSPVKKLPLSFETIEMEILKLAEIELNLKPQTKSFRITSRRSNKEFPLDSSTLNQNLGKAVLEKFSHLKVNLDNPDLNIHLEVREKNAFIYLSVTKGPGGLPVGMSGRGLLMLSGGIDSPVAGWMMLKRGMSVLPIHFASPPYTSVRARQKVIDLAKILQAWGGQSSLLIANFTDLQLKINESLKAELSTLLLRRAMVRLSEKAALKFKVNALITGENLGQVASQTVESMTATGQGCEPPIFRPLIGFDKMEIIQLAKRIESYETSILPYEDCCTIFLPANPKTKPMVRELEDEYKELGLDSFVDEALEKIEMVKL